MISELRPRFAALTRLTVIIAIFLTSCTVQPEQAPTPTLIEFPTLASDQGQPATSGETAMPGETAVGEQPTGSAESTEVMGGTVTAPTETGAEGSTPGAGETIVPLTPVVPSATSTETGPVIHTVAPGESLISIAAQYGVTSDAIITANRLTDPNLIYVGQKLTIPPAIGAAAAACKRDAAFVTDLTVPDNTVFHPGQNFTKTWRVKNTGTCAWDNTYTVVFGMGNQMGALSFVPLPATAAGGTADISIAMTAPPAPGKYTSAWFIRGPDGITFGSNPFVIITVIPAAQPLPPTSTPGPTPFPAQTQQMPPGLNYPAISGVTLNSRQIWLKGKALGNRRNVFAKIGDSLSDEPWFLHNIGDGQANYGNYGQLGPVADFFRKETARTTNSFSNTSVATHGGWDSFSPLDPANSTPWDFCGGDSPIVCELRVVKPSVALIMLGTNEASDHLGSGSYEQNLRKMVQASLDRGVIPVLYTIPWNKFRDPQPFNTVITRVARQYDIPLVDYWSVIDPLPNHGISSDGVHPSVPPDQNTANFTGDNLKYGYTQRNIVTLQVLDLIWRLELYE